MQLRTVRRPLKRSGFPASRLVFVLSHPLFFAQPITFLHFYQKTSISEIWLHLLWLPPRHCVSSLNQRALTAAAAGGGEEVADKHNETVRICLHPRCRFYLSASPQTNKQSERLASSHSNTYIT